MKSTMKIDNDGTRRWFLNGKLHREDGPAIELTDGSNAWWLNDKLHREDGPAIENADGTKRWYMNSKRHREDGPAIEWRDGDRHWWLNGKQILTTKEFQRKTKLTGADMTALILRHGPI